MYVASCIATAAAAVTCVYNFCFRRLYNISQFAHTQHKHAADRVRAARVHNKPQARINGQLFVMHTFMHKYCVCQLITDIN